MDVPKQWVVGNDVDGFIDGLRDQFIKEVGGKLASESPLSHAGHAGREIRVHMFRGDLRMQVFLVGDRVYILSLTKLDKASKSDEEPFKKFFGSFKVNPIVKPIATRFQFPGSQNSIGSDHDVARFDNRVNLFSGSER